MTGVTDAIAAALTGTAPAPLARTCPSQDPAGAAAPAALAGPHPSQNQAGPATPVGAATVAGLPLPGRRLAGLLVQATAAGVVVGIAATVLFLFAWSVLPLVIGWQPSVVVTGSMAPSIMPGDIVVTEGLDPADLRAGDVIRFVDPAQPDRNLMHRIVAVKPDGTMITRGDNNRSADPTPVPPANIEGVARLRVPMIGLAAVWLRERAFVPLGMTAAGVAVIAHVVSVLWAGAAPGHRSGSASGRGTSGRRRRNPPTRTG